MTARITLLATIGTRDLAFQLGNGEWMNIGNDRMNQDGFTEMAEVITDLDLSETEYLRSYRKLTKYLLDNIDTYCERVMPVILGKLIRDYSQDIERTYFIVTDQQGVRERQKDTLYSGQILKAWVEKNYPDIEVNLIFLGRSGEDPTDFDRMFRWWRSQWRDAIQVSAPAPIWVCLKGGVGQTSEAGRVSSLSFYGNRVQFFEFQQDEEANKQGQPSPYTSPSSGANYLWDRTQQQVLQQLKRYDYVGAEELLEPYFATNSSTFGALPTLLKAGAAWQRGQFETFFGRAKNCFPTRDRMRDRQWWWMAYEQAYLARIRLEQGYASEAMLHGFRAVEGMLWEWAPCQFPHDVKTQPGGYSRLRKSICAQFPSLERSLFHSEAEVELRGRAMQTLLEAAIPATTHSSDFKSYWRTATHARNQLSHRLGGIDARDVFKAWGQDIVSAQQWEKRILACLNEVTGQKFAGFEDGSLFHVVQIKALELTASYQL
ncbi:MAG: hypothetical protein AAFY57_18585 [Cyanobacteria bacterium J06642_2]